MRNWVVVSLLLMAAVSVPPAVRCEDLPVLPLPAHPPAMLNFQAQSASEGLLADIHIQLDQINLRLAQQNLLLQKLLNPPRMSRKKRALLLALTVVDHTGSVASIVSELGVVKK